MSMICPDCCEVLKEGSISCEVCNWKGEEQDGILILLSEEDKKDPLFENYLNSYTCLTSEDLENPLLNLNYVEYQARNLVSFMGHIVNETILDLGCGQGYLSKELIKNGANSVYAVDISLPYLKRLVHVNGIKVICANVERLPFKDEFKYAVCTDVFEHVLNPGAFLTSLNRSLVFGGRAFIRVPLNENLLSYSPIAGCKYKYAHLRAFNKKLLRDALTGAGFEVNSFRVDGFSLGTPNKYWLKQKRPYIYNFFQSSVYNYVKDPASVTTWPPFIARLFMKPHELIVSATKINEIKAMKPFGFILQGENVKESE